MFDEHETNYLWNEDLYSTVRTSDLKSLNFSRSGSARFFLNIFANVNSFAPRGLESQNDIYSRILASNKLYSSIH